MPPNVPHWVAARISSPFDTRRFPVLPVERVSDHPGYTSWPI